MTDDEKIAVLAVIAGADGGCGSCVGDLLNRLETAMPSIGWRKEWEALPLGEHEGYPGGAHYARIHAWEKVYDSSPVLDKSDGVKEGT